jgi:orotidine-5'-phosphate decarboxylase
MSFSARLAASIQARDSRICLGIDPRPEAHPSTHPEAHQHDPARTARAVAGYAREVMGATHDLIACVKPQAAFFEALGLPGLIALAQVIADARALDLPVILDAKRGDIGSTAEAYADAYLRDGVFSADALTVNPYLGLDTLEPFIAAALAGQRGLFILVKTSNPGSGDLQDAPLQSGEKLFERLARMLDARATELPHDAAGYTLLGVVAGATYPAELSALRGQLPQATLLVPGYGAQGAGADDVVHAFDANGGGAVINASRSLFYPRGGEGEGFAAAAREATLAMRGALNQAIAQRAESGIAK